MPNPSTESKKDDIPEVPPSVAARKPVALTQTAAESLGTKTYRSEQEDAPAVAVVAKAPKGKKPTKVTAKAVVVAKAPKGFKPSPEPLKGLTAAQVNEVRARSYPDAPDMDPMLGDQTPAFKAWLLKNHPRDHEIRYYAR
jgi:hypothetical protein